MKWRIIKHEISGNCEKFLVDLMSGHVIEVAAIRHNKMLHLCMPTQIGCAVHCNHCATTYSLCPFVGNIDYSTLSSITKYLVNKYSKEKIALSFSAHGEPLLNWKCISAIAEENKDVVHSVFVTSIGIVKTLDEILQSGSRFAVLYFSIHGSSDGKRALLIPQNASFANLEKLIVFTNDYVKSGGRVVWNYMLHSKNCTKEDAFALISLLQKVNVSISIRFTPYVSIISETESSSMIMPAGENEFNEFIRIMSENSEKIPNISFHVSNIEGKEINVACGQMRAHFLGENRK